MAITKVSDLATPEFRNLIEAEMLPRPDDKYIWRDIGIMRDFTDAPGIASVGGSDYGKLLVDKPQYFGEGYGVDNSQSAEYNRRLTDGTDISVSNIIGLGFDQFALVMREYAGPYVAGAVHAVAPVGITEFALRRSIHDLAGMIGSGLRRDFDRWQNAVLRDTSLGTTSVVTADAAQAEGALTANKYINWDMLLRLKKSLEDLLIAPFGNGRYRYIIGTRDENKLPVDTDIKSALMQNPANAPEFTSGFIGACAGFDFFVDTTMPTKGVGAGGAVTGYQGLAFGTLPVIGWVNGQAPEPRTYKNDDFGRKALFVWIAHQGLGTLDINNVCVRTLTT